MTASEVSETKEWSETMRQLSQPIGMNFKINTYAMIIMGIIPFALFAVWVMTADGLFQLLAMMTGAIAAFMMLILGITTCHVMKKAENASIEEFREKSVLVWDRKEYMVIEEEPKE